MTEAGGLLPDITVTPAVHIMNTETDLDSVALDPNHVTTAIGTTATMTLTEVNLGHSTGPPSSISPMIEAPAPTAAIMTHPTADIPLTGMPPKMTVDPTIDPVNATTNWPKDPRHLHTLHHGNLRTENINKSQSMTHHRITIVQTITTATLMMI